MPYKGRRFFVLQNDPDPGPIAAYTRPACHFCIPGGLQACPGGFPDARPPEGTDQRPRSCWYKGFSFAVQEFTKQEIDQRESLKERLNQAKQGLILMFEYGQKQGEFKEFDNESMALTLLLFLDSLEVNAYILGFTEEQIDKQLDFLLGAVKK